MTTPHQLRAALFESGYSVSERQLRDWRTEGLLPPLCVRGSGRGKGKSFYWDDPEILNRAKALCEVIRRRARFAHAHHLELWFAGYPVPTETTREAWIESLRRTEQSILHGASDADGIEDALSPLATLLSRAVETQIGIAAGKIHPLALEVVIALFARTPTFESLDDGSLATLANEWLSRASPRQSLSRISEETLTTGLTFIHRNMSLPRIRSVVSSASGHEFERAHIRWQRIQAVVKKLVEHIHQGRPSPALEAVGIRIAITFGSICMFALITADRADMGMAIDSELERLLSAETVITAEQSPYIC